MNEKERLQLEEELLMTCSKAQAINKYIDELEENYKLSELWCKSQQENARLQEERKQIKEYVEKCNFDNAEILFDFGSEYCYIDDFKEHILEILK